MCTDGESEPTSTVMQKWFESSEPATDGGSLGREFSIAVEAISGPTILGHLRLTSWGRTTRENNHPFLLNFLGYDWLLIHNGSAEPPEPGPYQRASPD